MATKAGLIGVGALGRALLKRLKAAGIEVQAFDPSPAAQENARQDGAIVAASPSAAARDVPFIHVIVASDDQAMQAVTAPDGVIAGASPGAVLFLHSTMLSATTKKIAEACAAKNLVVLDAPITAIPRRFEAGEGIFFVGGPTESVESIRGYLLQLGSTVHHVGPLGAGNVTKLAKNLYNASERVLLAEILDFVEAGGLDLNQFLAMQVATHDKPAVAEWADNFTIENGHASHRQTTNLFRKDVMLAAKQSELYGLDAPVTRGVAQTAKKWVEAWSSGKKT